MGNSQIMEKGTLSYSGLLSERKSYLEKQLKIAKEALTSAPEGHLRVSSSHGRSTYYYQSENTPARGKYLKQKDHGFAARLAQKEYDQAICNSMEAELKAINCFLRKMRAPAAEEVYQHLVVSRKALVKPIQMTDEEYASWWAGQPYERKPLNKDVPVIRTERGEEVRSKSEMIIADLLYQMHVPYKYECPVRLQGLGVVHPDFTVLNMQTRKEILWEHCGRMDDPGYLYKAYERQAAYTKNGYFQGKNIIYTFETDKMPLNSRMVRIYIEEYFL